MAYPDKRQPGDEPEAQFTKHEAKTTQLNPLGDNTTMDAIISENQATLDRILPIDQSRRYMMRKINGAKGGMLMEVVNLLEDPAFQALKGISNFLTVPPYQLLPVSLYNKWVQATTKEEKDQIVLERAQSIFVDDPKLVAKALHVRSSARDSEDGEKISGAGVYHSVSIKAGSTPEDLAKAITEVYESCNSEAAREYRERNGVPSESMGVVIQETMEGDLGHINSTQPQTDNSTTIYYGKYSASIPYVKSEITQSILEGRGTRATALDSLHMQPDAKKIDLRYTQSAGIVALLKFSQVAERFYGKPVQIEFVFGEGNNIYIVQMRPLPTMEGAEKTIEFPEEEPLKEFSASGVCDEVLDVLPFGQNNNDQHGAVIIKESHAGSHAENQEAIVRSFPKSGVIILLDPSRFNFGHVEMLAMERGLTVLFMKAPTTRPKSGTKLTQTAHGIAEQSAKTHHNVERTLDFGTGIKVKDMVGYNDFAGHSKIRVVTDGFRGCVYGVEKSEENEE